MVVTDTTPKGALTGARYIESLKDGREVWIDGEKVKDVTVHPAFRAMINELARVYDLQNSDQYRDDMTYIDPESGLRCSVSWLIVRTQEDSIRKRRNSELWNMHTWGQLGRSPDMLAPYITQLAIRAPAFSAVKHPKADFGENVLNYYKFCQQNDIFLTHALIDPQVNRSQQPQNEQRAVPEDEVALHVVEETNEGVIVVGGKQLATGAVHSQETYVSLNPTFFRRNDPRFVIAFSIPTGTPNMKILAREPISQWLGSWGHPFQNLDEQDCMLFFDHVLVPWDRIFVLYQWPGQDPNGSTPGEQVPQFAGWANLTRAHYRMRVMTAVATLIAEAIGVTEFREVEAKLGEMVNYCELWRLAMNGLEASGSSIDGLGGGTRVLTTWFQQTTGRMTELLRQICASGIIMQPSENDMRTPELKPYLERYMRGTDGFDYEYKARLQRFAHEIAASSFGMRQDIYEYWHGGDPNRNRINLFRGYNQGDITDRIKELCQSPQPHGELPADYSSLMGEDARL